MKQRAAWPSGVVSATAYGMTPTVATFAYTGGVSLTMLVFLRRILGGTPPLVLAAATGKLRAVPIRDGAILTFVCGPLFGAQLLCFFAAAQISGAQVAVVLAHVSPVFVLIFTALVLRRKLGLPTWAVCAVMMTNRVRSRCRWRNRLRWRCGPRPHLRGRLRRLLPDRRTVHPPLQCSDRRRINLPRRRYHGWRTRHCDPTALGIHTGRLVIDRPPRRTDGSPRDRWITHRCSRARLRPRKPLRITRADHRCVRGPTLPRRVHDLVAVDRRVPGPPRLGSAAVGPYTPSNSPTPARTPTRLGRTVTAQFGEDHAGTHPVAVAAQER